MSCSNTACILFTQKRAELAVRSPGGGFGGVTRAKIAANSAWARMVVHPFVRCYHVARVFPVSFHPLFHCTALAVAPVVIPATINSSENFTTKS